MRNIGGYHLDRGNYPEALKYYSEALKIYKKLENQKGISATLGSIGGVYSNQGDYPKALEHYSKALEIAQELEDKSRIAIWLGNIGSLFTAQKRYAEAEDFLNRSLSVAEEIGLMNMIKSDHKHLSNLFGELANLRKTKLYEKYENRTSANYYKLALGHYEKYLQANDTLFNEEKSESMGKMEGRHEFALAEIERERIANEELRIQHEEITHRNKVQYAIIFMVMVVVVLIAVLFLFAKFKISHKLKSGSVFITLLLLFEFILLITDTEIEKITNSDPVFKLGINAVLAIVFYFIQQYLGKILPVHKLSTSIPAQHYSSFFSFFLIFVLVLPLLSAFAPLRDTSFFSRKDANAYSTTNNETMKPLNNPLLSAFAPLRDTSFFSRKDANAQSTTNNETIKQSNNETIQQCYYRFTQDLARLLSKPIQRAT